MSVKHLNQGQLAERWGVSEATLERWRSEGIGPVFLKLQGRSLKGVPHFWGIFTYNVPRK